MNDQPAPRGRGAGNPGICVLFWVGPAQARAGRLAGRRGGHILRPMSKQIRIAASASVLALATLSVPAPQAQAQAQAQAQGSFTVLETGQSFSRLQDAVDAIGDNTGRIAIAPGTYRQCAVQEAGEISYLASEAGSAIFDGTECEGKAALVLRGRAAEVSGLVFQNMRVADRNGAGIRLETGNLTVAQSWFRDSEQGILSGDGIGARIVIDHSTFSRLGTCEGSGGCAHSIYTGEYGQLRITNSRFEEGAGGHYVKSWASRVDIASTSFDDTRGRGTNYMIDLSGGSTGQISNNWFVQGRDKENYSAFITVAPEEHRNSANGLQVVGNTARLAPGVSRETAFVADWSGDRIHIADNRLAGGIAPYERR